MVEPLADRMSSVEDFLRDVDPSLQYHIVPISDPFGPTKEDPNLEVSGIINDCVFFSALLTECALR
jgi:phosphopantetheine adenylyltransferase